MPGDPARTVAVYDDLEGLSLAAAGLFAVEARRQAGAGDFNVLLSGGETPRRCYQLLGEEPLRSSIPWSAVQLFWGDERHVPHDDPHSNFGMVEQAMLRRVPLSPNQIHPVPFCESAAASARSYQELLQRRFGTALPRFQLALLGLGGDGHTASLFPGSAVLQERERWVCEVSLPEQRMERVTLTLPLLNASALVAFLVYGEEKAAVLQQVLENHGQPALPAQLVAPCNGRVFWLVDRAAASLLSRATLGQGEAGTGTTDR